MRIRAVAGIVCAALLLGGGCSPPPAVRMPGATPAPAPGEAAYLRGIAALREGDPEEAARRFAAAWEQNPGHPGVSREFPAAVAALKRAGDEAQRQGKAEEAGRRWVAALRYLAHPAVKDAPPPISRAEVRESVDRLSERLMEKGLQEYRSGRIEVAIATWRTILAYDPSHAEASASVRTAVTQLENLRKIAPTPPK